MILTKKQEAVALTLFSWFTYKKRHYGLIAQDWLLKQIELTQGVTMSVRTLNRCLQRLRELDLLITEQRHRRDLKTGEFCPEISIYYFTDELKQFVRKVFGFFKRLFGFGDLTEYTVSAKTDTSRQSPPSAQPSQKTDPPDMRPPNWPNWSALGKARA